MCEVEDRVKIKFPVFLYILSPISSGPTVSFSPLPSLLTMSLFFENLGQRILYSWRGASEYSVLPTGSPIVESVSWRARGQRALLTKRYARILVVGLVSILVLLFMFKVDGPVNESEEFVLLPQAVEVPGKPPLYRQYHEYEEQLPQHNPNLPFPDGKNAKFLWIANHAHCKSAFYTCTVCSGSSQQCSIWMGERHARAHLERSSCIFFTTSVRGQISSPPRYPKA